MQFARLPSWAQGVWDVQEGATMRMVLLVMRADMIARSAINQAADIATFKPVRLLLNSKCKGLPPRGC